MAVYDEYADRGRVRAGVAIKDRQNRHIFSLGRKYMPSGINTILEIGPGDGYIAELARESQLDYTAIEASQGVAKNLIQRGITVHRAHVPPLPTPALRPYGCCFLLHVLEHMESAQTASRLLAELHQTIVPGGALVIACPDYVRWGSDFFDCDYTHSYPITRRRLFQLAKDHEFEVVHSTVYIGPIFGAVGLPLAWLARLCYPRSVDNIIGASIPNDVANRGLLTFLPNLLAVLRRRP